MSDFWLRCDVCRRSVETRADSPMQMAMVFKPSLFPWPIPKTHPDERRHRCRACGFVTILVPAGDASSPDTLDESWRAVTVKQAEHRKNS